MAKSLSRKTPNKTPKLGALPEWDLTDLYSGLDSPEIKDGIVSSIEPKGPFGAKEVGEGALAGMLAAVANAVYDATGVRVTSLPITPDKILEGLGRTREL